MVRAPADPQVHIHLLGEFRVDIGSIPVSDAVWRRRAAKRLVKLLAVTADHRLHREQVLHYLWPDLPPRDAATSFRQILHLARHALQPTLRPQEPSAYLHVSNDLVSLGGPELIIDVDDFLGRSELALRTKQPADLEAALAAYAGQLLPDEQYEDWSMDRRQYLQQRYHLLLEAAAVEQVERGDLPGASERLARIIAEDPLREDIHRRLITIYASSGARHQAIRQYRECVRLLQSELEVKPEPETERLYRSILEGSFVPPTAPHRLPLPRAVSSPSGPLVARQRAIEVLEAALAAGERGQGHGVLVGGEAGTGKTRLVMELARMAHRRGFAVLWGRSYAGEGELPYGSLLQAMDAALPYVGAEVHHEIAGCCPELAPLLPSLRGASLQPGTDEVNKNSLFTAFVHGLESIADRAPLLLVFDDLHCADAGTLHVLHHLARQAASRRWLLIGTYRDEEVQLDGPLPWLLLEGTRDGFLQRLDLLRLARPDCDRLITEVLGGRWGADALARIYTLSLGNPSVSLELALNLGSGGCDPGDSPPEALHHLLLPRLQRLDEPSQRTLEVAAVIGNEFSFTLLQQATQISEEFLLEVLDRALRTRIIEERGHLYAFHHPLLRTMLYDGLSRARRQFLHGRVGEALETSAQPEIEALAYHFARSSQREKAVSYLERAGDRARQLLVHDVAVARYEEALQQVPAGDEARNLALREKVALGLADLGRPEDALQSLQIIAGRYRQRRDHAGHARIAVAMARLSNTRGETHAGLDLIGGAPLEHLSPGEQVEAHSTFAHLYRRSGRHEEQLRAAQLAVAAAEQVGDPARQAEAKAVLGSALLYTHHFEDGLAVLEEAIAVGEQSGQASVVSASLANVAWLHEWRGDFSAAHRAFLRALAEAKRANNRTQIAYRLFHLGRNAYLRGAWTTARRQLDLARTVAEQAAPNWVEPYPILQLGQISLAEGDVAAADALLHESLALAEAREEVRAVRTAQQYLAELDIVQGRPATAVRRLQRLRGAIERQEAEALSVLPSLAYALIYAEHSEAAHEILDEAERLARNSGAMVTLIRTLSARGLAWQQEGQPEDASRILTDALELSRSIAYPFGEAWVRYYLGSAQLLTGQQQAGAVLLEEARALFQSLGANGYVRYVVHALHHAKGEISA